MGKYLWCNLPVWCSCRTCINYSIQQGGATCCPRAKCNTKWIFMPATSQGRIKVVWGPWLKLTKGPFLYIWNCHQQGKIKWMNWSICINETKKLECKNEPSTNMDVTILTNSLIVISSLRFLLETWKHIDKF